MVAAWQARQNSSSASAPNAPRTHAVTASTLSGAGARLRAAGPEASIGSHFAFCSSVPPQMISSAAISLRVPREPTPI